MNKSEFIEQLKLHFKNWDENSFELFERYHNLLQRENEKYNLTRLASDDLIYEKYFFASLIPFLKTDLKNKVILDIGSGSGIPGIVLKIIEPSIKLFVIEASNKKANFLSMLCDELGFSDVKVLCKRAEEIVKEFVDCCDIVTSRAVASIPILLEISAVYAKINGTIVIPKSLNYLPELESAECIQSCLHLKLDKCEEFIFNKISYYTITYIKTAPTPKGYPRAWKEIIKKDE